MDYSLTIKRGDLVILVKDITADQVVDIMRLDTSDTEVVGGTQSVPYRQEVGKIKMQYVKYKGAGCGECGSPSRHKASCSKSWGKAKKK